MGKVKWDLEFKTLGESSNEVCIHCMEETEVFCDSPEPCSHCGLGLLPPCTLCRDVHYIITPNWPKRMKH